MFKQEIKNIKEGRADLRKFGLTVGTVLFLLGIILYLTGKALFIYLGGTGILLILLAVFLPEVLKPVNKVWMSLAVVLGWFMSRVILVILFYIVLTPMAILLKIASKEFLSLKIDKKRESYWIKRDKQKSDRIDYERQF